MPQTGAESPHRASSQRCFAHFEQADLGRTSGERGQDTVAEDADKDSENLEAGETKGMKLANPLAEDDDGDDGDDDKSKQDDADLE
eukprot:COSAG05_NODE_1876_length_3913_cov_86.680126_4_plen_86_part_00